MKKLISALAVLTLAFTAFFATPANAATHSIKAPTQSERAQAWKELDARPSTVNTWLKQGSKLSVAGKSKTPTATYPMRSIPAKGGGYWVFTVSPNSNNIRIGLTPKQYSALKNVLPACKYEDSLNCYWEGSKRGNKRGKDIVSFQMIIAEKR